MRGEGLDMIPKSVKKAMRTLTKAIYAKHGLSERKWNQDNHLTWRELRAEGYDNVQIHALRNYFSPNFLLLDLLREKRQESRVQGFI